MQYDRLGFPVPPEFNVPAGIDDFGSSARDPSGRTGTGPSTGTSAAGSTKRWVVLALLLGVVIPGLVVPAALPMIREAVVQWSLERAFGLEARGDVAGAIEEIGRAIDWADAQGDMIGRLRCWRAMLRIENGDARGAVDDTSEAILAVPTSTQPRRVRALAHVVLDEADAALADANAAVEMGARDSPDALNHRAYIRALLGRELPQALDDIDRALAGNDEGAPELLDTRGFILHLLGRHQEAIDLLNRAIDQSQQQRRQVAMLSGRADSTEIAYRLRSLDHGLAVMHHHRGLACRAAGLEGQAAQDLEIALRKGFAPERGIF
jgi:tetratricopeptide (TPR) repeat protein